MPRGNMLKIASIVLIVLLVLVSLSYLTVHGLHPDEAHYWSWSRHLSLGYYDNAPMVAYVIRLFTGIMGKSEFAMRFPSWLTYCFLIYLTFVFARRVYGGKRVGYIAAVLTAATPIYLVGNALITSDVTNVLFSALTVVFAYPAVEEDKKTCWIWAGAAFGLALLSKYQSVLIGLSLLLMLILTRDGRRRLRTPQPYLAALLSLLIFTPVIIWNWQHDWLSFRFQLSHGFHGETLSPTAPFVFLLGQMISLSPLFHFALVFFIIKAVFYRQDRRRGDVFLLYCTLPTFLFFALTSIKGMADVQWPIDAVFPALVFLAGRIDKAWRESTLRGKRAVLVYWSAAVVLAAGMMGLIRYPEFIKEKVLTGLNKNAVLTNKLYGWSELGCKTDRAIRGEFGGENDVPVFVTDYGIGGAVSFYAGNERIVVLAAPLVRRNQFDQYTLAEVDRFSGAEGLLVASREGFAERLVPRFFSSVILLDIYERSRFGELLGVYHIYRVQGIDGAAIREAVDEKSLGF